MSQTPDARQQLMEAQRLLEAARQGGPQAYDDGMRAVDILRAALGPHHPHVAGAMLATSYACYETRNLDAAEALVRGAMRIWREHAAQERPEIAVCLNNIGRIEEERGRFSEGVALHQQAVDMRLRLLGDHPDTAFSLGNLGAAQAGAEQWHEAAQSLAAAIACYERLGMGHDPAAEVCRGNLELCRTQRAAR